MPTMPIGLAVPKLLPIAGTFAAPFTLYYALLSLRVVTHRNETATFIGTDVPSTSNTSNKNSSRSAEQYDLEVATRSHANFAENVPLAFVLLAIAELNGGNRKVLTVMMSALLVFRVAHVEAGLTVKGKWGDCGIGRPIGFVGTQAVLLGMSGYTASLVKGYWGY